MLEKVPKDQGYVLFDTGWSSTLYSATPTTTKQVKEIVSQPGILLSEIWI